MAHIEERTRKDKDGKTVVRYRAKVFLHEDSRTGKQKTRSKTFDTEEEAAAWAAQKELERSRGTLDEPSRESFADYGRFWLDQVKKDGVRARTWERYSADFRRYIEDPPEGAPYIGDRRMDRLRTEHIQTLYRWLMDDHGLAPASIRGLHAVVRMILKYADRTGAIPRNISEYVSLPKKQDNEVQAMSREELDRFLEAAEGEDTYALWYLLPTTGLRPAEALGLRWQDVDLEERKLRVRKSLVRIRGEGLKLTPPKRKGSRRTVKLSAALTAVLREHRTRQAKARLKAGPDWEDNDLVFTTQTGSPQDWGNLTSRAWVRIMERAGLGDYGPEPEKPDGQPGPRKKRPFEPSYRPYDLRHTCATLLLEKGVNPKVVQERLGHYSAAFTLDVYSAFVPDMQDTAADAMDDILKGGSG